MPTYEYRCKSCGSDFEIVRSMKDRDAVMCPECSSPAVIKVFHAPNMKVSGKEAKVPDKVIKSELLEKYGVQNVVPFQGASLSEVYNEIKTQGSLVNERMQREKEIKAAKRRAEKKEFFKRSMRIAEPRYHKMREMKQAEAAEKRAITVN